MIDVLKKSLYTGLGLAFMTREKIEDLSREMVKLGKLTEQEGRDLVAELTKKSEEAGRSVREHIDNAVKQQLQRMNLVTRDDYNELKRELEILKSRIGDVNEDLED